MIQIFSQPPAFDDYDLSKSKTEHVEHYFEENSLNGGPTLLSLESELITHIIVPVEDWLYNAVTDSLSYYSLYNIGVAEMQDNERIDLWFITNGLNFEEQ